MGTYTIPVSEAKNKLTFLLENISTMWDRYILTKNGRNAAVIMSYEEYEGWLETLSLTEEEKAALEEGRVAASEGKGVLLEELLS